MPSSKRDAEKVKAAIRASRVYASQLASSTPPTASSAKLVSVHRLAAEWYNIALLLEHGAFQKAHDRGTRAEAALKKVRLHNEIQQPAQFWALYEE